MNVEEMYFPGFTNEDFNVFAVPGLDLRMEALKNQLRPKLHFIGEQVAPLLTHALSVPMFAHVARHARRKTNPPQDSWVAFSQDPRGYKKWPTFMIGLWHTHLFVQFGVIYESPLKQNFGLQLERAYDSVRSAIPSDYLVYPDHTVPEGLRLGDLTKSDFYGLTERVKNRKNADLLFGIEIARGVAMGMEGEQALHLIEEACAVLAALYPLAFELGE